MTEVVLFDREFRLMRPAAGKMIAERLSWRLPGGAERARIRIEGLDFDQELGWALDLIRCGARVIDGCGQTVWDGYVHSVEAVHGATRLVVCLDGMANRVAVKYEDLNPRAAWMRADQITDFVEDGESAAVYGVKEWIGNLPNATPSAAAQAAATWLQKKAFPQKSVKISNGSGMEVILDCRGWWDTLDWKFYRQEAGFCGHVIEGKGEREVGRYSSAARAAQGFVVPAGGLETLEAWVRIAKVEEPMDQVEVSIVADNSGAPCSPALASGMVDGSDLTGGFNWTRFSVVGASLTAGNTYWLVVRRSGAVDANNYYLLQTDEGMGYTAGSPMVWNGSSWVSKNADLNFAVLGGEETTAQIERIAWAGGQFLEGVRLMDVSGVDSLLWRDLRRTCKEEILDLMAIGCADGSPLDAMVDDQRWLVVWKRKTAAEWKMDAEGRLFSLAGVAASLRPDWLGGVAVTAFGESVRVECMEDKNEKLLCKKPS